MPDRMAAPAGLRQLLLRSCALQLFVWGIAVLRLSSSPTQETPNACIIVADCTRLSHAVAVCCILSCSRLTAGHSPTVFCSNHARLDQGSTRLVLSG